MSDETKISECEKLMAQIYDEEQKLYDLYRMKDIYERNLRDMKKKLYQTCEHEWVRDWEDRDERSRWICSKCKLQRHAYY